MNYPSNPNPNSTDYPELFKFYDFDDIANFQMIMDEISRDDHSPSPTLSWTSSEKFVAPEVTSSLQTNLATSPSLEIGDKDGIKKTKRHKDDPIIHVFKTKSIEKYALDDGYKWRKYGKKPIRGSSFPRHYHKCSNPYCIVKKKIERDTNNPEYVLTTYEGVHNHPSPSVVYCDSDDFDFTSLNTWSFQTHTYSFSHSAP